MGSEPERAGLLTLRRPVDGSWRARRSQYRVRYRITDDRREVGVLHIDHRGDAYARWGYVFTRADGGTRVTESWEFLPDGIAMFCERSGDDADDQIANRAEAAHNGIPVTLAAIKQTAESG